MSDKYVKTSAEELTAMADELRAVGSFQEGQQFVFSSSEDDENPVYTFKIVEGGAWSKITRAEVDELVEQGYDAQEVDEFPAIGEAAVNTVYFTIQRQLGFAEAYQELISNFYLRVIHGDLTQEDIEDYVIDANTFAFYQYNADNYNDFPNITKVKVTLDWLNLDFMDNNIYRIQSLEEVEIINSEQVQKIPEWKFANFINLMKIQCSPVELEDSSFLNCTNLIVGENGLDLSNCISYGYNCLYQVPIEEITIASGAEIYEGAFYDTGLTIIHLPDIPPDLKNPPNEVFPNTAYFYVSSQSIIDEYGQATNWCDLVTNNRFKTEGELNGSNQ